MAVLHGSQRTVTVDGIGLPGPLRYLARQPILDGRGHVRAYELFHREGVGTAFTGDGERATQTMMDNTVMFGLQSLTNSLPAFVNCTTDTLIGQQIRVLPAGATVLEILESVQPGKEVVDACRDLKKEGYRLALDDFVYRPALEPLIEIADYIKIDYLNTSREVRHTIYARLKNFRGVRLAEKIETETEFVQAREDGCTLFQGYYFCKPSLLAKRTMPSNRLVHLRMLQMLQEDPLNLRQLSESIKLEPSIAYRLLRYANSPLCGMRQPVTSIQTAMLTVGDDMMRRIGTLAVASALNSASSPEVLRMALVRARFCEVTSSLRSLDATEQHLMGLFSLLPAMLQKPMEEALSGLPLREPIRDALLGEKNLFRCPLEWLELHERGEFEKAESMAGAHGFDAQTMAERFMQAAGWADQLLAE